MSLSVKSPSRTHAPSKWYLNHSERNMDRLDQPELPLIDTENISQVRKKADLIAIVQALRESSRRGGKNQLEALPVPAATTQLPLWPEAVRAVPNGILRSALFGAVRKGKPKYLEKIQIAAQDGVEIEYTGARLDQFDLDIWQAVLHVARVQELGCVCRVSVYQLLKILGLVDTGGNRKSLDLRLSRLKATGLNIIFGSRQFEGSLIRNIGRDTESKQYLIELDPHLWPLFAEDQFTLLDWATRYTLAGQPLAQWLHGYYSTHAKPFPVKVETLHRLCGSEAGVLSDFAKKLRKALNAVAEASEAQGQVFSYEILGGLVHVEKKAKGAQLRHLVKKAGQPRA